MTSGEIPIPLPRGRHGLSRETISASQRGRLLAAMVNLSADIGYGEITIGRLVQSARVARRTFYEHFGSLEECFLEAYDYTAQQIIAPLIGAFDPGDDAARRAEAYVCALLNSLAERPALARMLLIEVGSGGSAAHSRRLAMHRRLARAILELNRRTRERGVAVPELSEPRALALVGALTEIMHVKIHDDGPERLPEAAADMIDIVVVLVATPSAGA